MANPTLAILIGRLWPKPTLAKTDFGQNRLWPKPTLAQNRLWPNRLWPKPTLAKTDFDLLCVVCCVVLCVCVVCVAWVLVGFHVWVLVSRFGLDRPPSPGPPKISRFFSLSRRKIRFFLPSLGVFSWNFGGVFEGWETKMCTFRFSGCRVKPRRFRGRRGFTRQPENSKRAHLSAPALQTPPKFHEKTPREGRKSAKFWAPHPSSPHFFWVWARHPSGPHPSGPHFFWVWAPTLRAPTFSGFRPPPFGPPLLFLGLGPWPA